MSNYTAKRRAGGKGNVQPGLNSILTVTTVDDGILQLDYRLPVLASSFALTDFITDGTQQNPDFINQFESKSITIEFGSSTMSDAALTFLPPTAGFISPQTVNID